MKLSVIIPLGRPETAMPTFSSLTAQSVKPDDWEIIAVGVRAAELAHRFPQLPIRPVVLEKNLIPPHTRVEGCKAATGDWYLFVDDDIELAPDFMDVLLKFIPSHSDGLGALGVRLPGRQGKYFERLTDITNFWSQQGAQAGPRDWLYSATIAIPAPAYHRAGGFNPLLPNAEDVDLTQRIVKEGYRLWYEPSLVAYHNHRRTGPISMWRYFWYSGNTAQCWHQQCEYPRVFSIKTALAGALLNLRTNWRLNRRQVRGLWWNAPLILLNYVIFQLSIEWHYQRYLWTGHRFQKLAPLLKTDRLYLQAASRWLSGGWLTGSAIYVLTMGLDFLTPTRR